MNMKIRETDLLYGITSYCDPFKKQHYFLGDFDSIQKKTIIRRIKKVLFEKHKFGNVYLVKSGKGFHVLSFSNKLTLRKYAQILKDMKADSKYIEWIKKVGYGVLRVSRRSSHMSVPRLTAVFISPYNRREDTFKLMSYLLIINTEQSILDVKRVRIWHSGRWFNWQEV